MARKALPLLAVDALIALSSPQKLVLVRRKNPPHGWALPGGFVDGGESVERACVREALEETTLNIKLGELLGVYSKPERDPRRHVVSVVFTATAEGVPHGCDDAAEARAFDLDCLPEDIVFDHKDIIRDYRTFLETGARPRPSV
eukprot:TRINITY_DN7963_c0_g1_i2.p1 TRINITY_DN7963_c0_g1~~TRINITY_DN7963_c0_g1_i2.p1  ORF type:complete len:158 (+),score=23.69 TRINITY_DN7963_c0_g1_i2:43-474(+)